MLQNIILTLKRLVLCPIITIITPISFSKLASFKPLSQQAGARAMTAVQLHGNNPS